MNRASGCLMERKARWLAMLKAFDLLLLLLVGTILFPTINASHQTSQDEPSNASKTESANDQHLIDLPLQHATDQCPYGLANDQPYLTLLIRLKALPDAMQDANAMESELLVFTSHLFTPQSYLELGQQHQQQIRWFECLDILNDLLIWSMAKSLNILYGRIHTIRQRFILSFPSHCLSALSSYACSLSFGSSGILKQAEDLAQKALIRRIFLREDAPKLSYSQIAALLHGHFDVSESNQGMRDCPSNGHRSANESVPPGHSQSARHCLYSRCHPFQTESSCSASLDIASFIQDNLFTGHASMMLHYGDNGTRSTGMSFPNVHNIACFLRNRSNGAGSSSSRINGSGSRTGDGASLLEHVLKKILQTISHCPFLEEPQARHQGMEERTQGKSDSSGDDGTEERTQSHTEGIGQDYFNAHRMNNQAFDHLMPHCIYTRFILDYLASGGPVSDAWQSIVISCPWSIQLQILDILTHQWHLQTMEQQSDSDQSSEVQSNGDLSDEQPEQLDEQSEHQVNQSNGLLKHQVNQLDEQSKKLFNQSNGQSQEKQSFPSCCHHHDCMTSAKDLLFGADEMQKRCILRLLLLAIKLYKHRCHSTQASNSNSTQSSLSHHPRSSDCPMGSQIESFDGTAFERDLQKQLIDAVSAFPRVIESGGSKAAANKLFLPEGLIDHTAFVEMLLAMAHHKCKASNRGSVASHRESITNVLFHFYYPTVFLGPIDECRQSFLVAHAVYQVIGHASNLGLRDTSFDSASSSSTLRHLKECLDMFNRNRPGHFQLGMLRALLSNNSSDHDNGHGHSHSRDFNDAPAGRTMAFRERSLCLFRLAVLPELLDRTDGAMQVLLRSARLSTTRTLLEQVILPSSEAKHSAVAVAFALARQHGQENSSSSFSLPEHQTSSSLSSSSLTGIHQAELGSTGLCLQRAHSTMTRMAKEDGSDEGELTELSLHHCNSHGAIGNGCITSDGLDQADASIGDSKTMVSTITLMPSTVIASQSHTQSGDVEQSLSEAVNAREQGDRATEQKDSVTSKEQAHCAKEQRDNGGPMQEKGQLLSQTAVSKESASTIASINQWSKGKKVSLSLAQSRYIAALRIIMHPDFPLLMLTMDFHEGVRDLSRDKMSLHVNQPKKLYSRLCKFLASFYPRLRHLQTASNSFSDADSLSDARYHSGTDSSNTSHRCLSAPLRDVSRLSRLAEWLKDFVFDFVSDLRLNRQQRLAILDSLSTSSFPDLEHVERFQQDRLPPFLHDLNRPFGMLNLRFLRIFLRRPRLLGQPRAMQSAWDEWTEDEDEEPRQMESDEDIDSRNPNSPALSFLSAVNNSSMLMRPMAFHCLPDYLAWKMSFQLVHPNQSILAGLEEPIDGDDESDDDDEDDEEQEDVYLEGFLYGLTHSFNHTGHPSSACQDEEIDEMEEDNPFALLKKDEFKFLVPLYQSVLAHLQAMSAGMEMSGQVVQSQRHQASNNPILEQQLKTAKITLLQLQEAIIMLKLLHPNGHVIHLDSFVSSFPSFPSSSSVGCIGRKLIERVLSCLFSADYMPAVMRRLE